MYTDQLHYQYIGDGTDVLLIHGWVSSSGIWRTPVQMLKGQFRFWLIDLPGFGDSPLTDAEHNLQFHTDVLIDFCDRHQLRPQVVVGHSMGGMLAIKIALERPDLMKHLVLICPTITGRFGWIDLSPFVRSSFGQWILDGIEPLWNIAQQLTHSPMAMGLWYLDHAMNQQIMYDIQRASWQAGKASLVSIAHENLAPYLHQIQHPTLLIGGKYDRVIPPTEAQFAAEYIPNAEFVLFEHSHHLPHEEEPEHFAEIWRDFLHTE